MAKKRFLSKYDDQKIWWLRFIRSILIFGIIVFLLFAVVFGISRVSGHSMYPTLSDGDIVCYFRLDKNYERGDIISVRMPNREYYIKRVVAVAGDTVDIREGILYINDVPESGTYINGKTEQQEYAVYPYTVKEGTVFAVGDNREVSIDSRTYGAFSVSQSRGTILFVK